MISIVLPLYNVANYIEACLVSILEQSIQNFEIIIVDDASTDNSLSIAEGILERQNSIPFSVIKNEQNKGIATVRNIGIANVHGDFVVFVDSDDTVAPNYLECLSSAFQNEDVDISVCQYDIVDLRNENETIRRPGECSMQLGLLSGDDALRILLNDQERSFLWRCMFRRGLFTGVRFPDECNFMEDTITLPCLYANARFVFYLEDVLYTYSYRPISMTTGGSRVKDYSKVPAALADVILHLKEKKGRYFVHDISRFNFLCCYNMITVKLTRKRLSLAAAKMLYAIFAAHLFKTELSYFIRHRKMRSLKWIFTLKYRPKIIWNKILQ